MLDEWIAGRMGLSCPLSREAVAGWQLDRLKTVVAYARAHSGFYRERLPETEFRSLSDFAALPLTTAEDLKRCGGQMLCVPPDDIDRVVTLTTSGSTGRPKRVYFTADDQELTVEYFHHGMGELVSPGDRVMTLFPGGSPGSLNDLLGRGLERMGAELLRFGFPAPERYSTLLDEILARKVTALVGPASALGRAARYSEEMGRARAVAGQLRSVLLAAEFAGERDRTAIETIWRCRVDEEYAMTETGFCGALSCSAPGAYHVWESDLYYEIVDPDSGQPLPEGQLGEIVVTTLSRKGMPMIRYRTGDLSRFLPGACPCGSALRKLERVRARAQDKQFTERRLPSLEWEV